MTPPPRVSVIVPAFNAERFIRETLDSVLAQNYPSLEIIVVDDGSTDETAHQVLSYGPAVKYLRERNSGGAARPRNVGLQVATGELIAFLDADDVMKPGRIAREVDFLCSRPDVGLVFSNYRDFGARIEPTPHFESCPLLARRLAAREDIESLILEPMDSTELLLTENFGSSSPMVRREVALAVGGYDELSIPSEDFDFQFRVASRYRIGLMRTVGWSKRDHPTNLSANTPRVLERKIAVRRRILDSETIGRRRRKLKRKIADCHADLAYFYTGRNNAMALRHLLSSLRLTGAVRARLVARLALDLVGRNTNNLRGRQAAQS
jgi:glycosyltransferase involved in cell wall biosynthesis